MIWLHGVSVGESLANLTLAKRLEELYPNTKILLTSTTKTSERILRKNVSNNIFYDKYPFDFPWKVRSFLKKWNPSIAIFGESELWPFMLFELKRKKIPAIVVNGRLSEKSFNRWKKLPFIIQPMLKAFSLIITQTEDEKERYKQLNADNVINLGNIKFASPPLTYNEKELEDLKKIINNRHVVLYASTHAPEESIAVKIHKDVKKRFPDLLSIIVPRHPERGTKIASDINAELNTVLRDTNKAISPDTDIYIANTLGEMGLFYALAPFCFLGNSLMAKPGGGHNPIEPAQLHCAVIYGPEMFNFKQIDQEMLKENASLKIQNIDNLKNVLIKALSDNIYFDTQTKNAYQYAQSKQQVMSDVLEKITPIIDTALHGST